MGQTKSSNAENFIMSWGRHGAIAVLIVNKVCQIYHKISNISRTLVGNKIVDHSDVVGALPVSTAPTTSSFTT